MTREGTLSLGGPGLVGGRDAREWTPDDLQIAGLVPMSTVDWPGKFVASLFLQGCPWACPYCHNSAIIDPRIPGVVAWSALEDLLARRRGLLDGVVFSGGEATRQDCARGGDGARARAGFWRWPAHRELSAAPRRVARRGPRRLGGHRREGDPLAITRPWPAATGAGERAWESLGIVLAHPEVDHEVRLTVYPDGPGDRFEVAARAREMGARTFALQQARDLEAPAGFSATRPGWDDQVRSLARDIETLDFDRFIFRGDS